MDIDTLNLLVGAAVTEEQGNMTDEKRAEIKSKLVTLGMVPADGSGLQYEDFIRQLQDIRTMAGMVFTGSKSGVVDNFFDGDFEKIAPMDYKSIEGMFLAAFDDIADAGYRDKFEFPFINRELEGMAIEANGESIMPEDDYDEDEPEETEMSELEEEDLGEDVEEEGEKKDEHNLTEEEREDLEEAMFVVCKAVAMGLPPASIRERFKEDIEDAGANFDAAFIEAEDIVKEAIQSGYEQDDWRESTPDIRKFFKTVYPPRYGNLFMSIEDREKGIAELSDAILKLGSAEVSTRLMTDKRMRELAWTGNYFKGSREMRLVTTGRMFNADLTPVRGGIFGDQFGPLKGQSCDCGKCNNLADDTDARNGATCPECHTLIKSYKDRQTSYGLIKSPIPLLNGRNELIAACLDSTEWNANRKKEDYLSATWVVNEFEQCSEKVYFAVYSDGSTKLVVEDGELSTPWKGEKRYYGTRGLEMVMKRVAGEVTVDEDGTEIPKALANAQNNLKNKYEFFQNSSGPSEGGNSSYYYTQAAKSYNKAVNFYAAIRDFLEEGNTFDELLVHNILVTPPGTRPTNDRNSSSDYGEENKQLSALASMASEYSDMLSLSGDNLPDEEMRKMEQAYINKYKEYMSTNYDAILKKTGMEYSSHLTAKGDQCVRGVIGPSDNLAGQRWYQENCPDLGTIPAMDLIGLPRKGARVMYRDLIEAKLRKEYGYTTQQITEAFEVPADTMVVNAEGIEERCVVDKVLDDVIRNNGQGQMCLYSRQPIISNGSLQAGYVYLTDDVQLKISVSRTKAMAADFDGDSIMASRILTPKARAELRYHMNNSIIDEATGELMVGPRHESLYGLYKATGPVENYKFGEKVIVDEDRIAIMQKQGIMQGNKMKRTYPVTVHHVVEELSDAELKVPRDKTVLAGTVYAVTKDGRELRAEEDLYIQESEGRLFSVTVVDDYILCPQGSTITDKRILEADDALCSKIRHIAADHASIINGLRNGLYAVNQPITVVYGDGTEVDTTPGRAVVEYALGHSIDFDAYNDGKGLRNGEWEKLLVDEIMQRGADDAKLAISALTHLGHEMNEFLVEKIRLQVYPTTESLDHALVYKDTDEAEAEAMIFGHENINLDGCTLMKDEEELKENKYHISKGEAYAWDKDGNKMVAEYDMYIRRNPDTGEIRAEDAVCSTSMRKGFEALVAKLDELEAKEADPNVKMLASEKAALEKYRKLYLGTILKFQEDYYAAVNEIRAPRYNAAAKENGNLVLKQVSHYKNNYMYDFVEAGIKSKGFIKGIIDSPLIKDYRDNYMDAAGGGMRKNGTSGVAQSITAPVNGNKTRGIAETGASGNEEQSHLMTSIYRTGDCGTDLFESHTVNDSNLEEKMQELDGRTIAEDVVTPKGDILAKKGEYFTPSLIKNAYQKGVTDFSQRSALYCKCDGSCAACFGKGKGFQPTEGANVGMTGKNAFQGPLSQATMSRAKADGKEILDGATVMQTICSGADIKRTVEDPVTGKERPKTVGELAEEMKASFYDYGIDMKTLPPVYAELITKTHVQYMDPKYHLPFSLTQAINAGLDPKAAGVTGNINRYAATLQNNEMSWMSKDSSLSRFGAYIKKGMRFGKELAKTTATILTRGKRQQ